MTWDKESWRGLQKLSALAPAKTVHNSRVAKGSDDEHQNCDRYELF